MNTKNTLRYVICAYRNATDDNINFAGAKEIDYLGRNYSYFGYKNFVPYATYKSAENAKKVWEKRFKHPIHNNGWEHIIGEVLPLTEQNVKQFKAQIKLQKQKADSVIRRIQAIGLPSLHNR